MELKTGNQLELEIIAFHGWGFDSGFWQVWEEILPSGVIFKTADRGYFNSGKELGFSKSNARKILFLHSFGVHWSQKHLFREASYIVIFNGFKKFHPDEAGRKKKSKTILQKMITEFEKNPKKVLKKFWENTYSPEKTMYTPGYSFNKELLLKDLEKLNKASFDVELLKNGTPIISLDGGNDKILESSRGKVFTEFTSGNAVYHFIKGAGHGMPVTHAKDCWSFINAMIPIFQHNGNYRSKTHQ